MSKEAFPKTAVIRQALAQMPADRPREAVSIHIWLNNDGRHLYPKGMNVSLDDVEQILTWIENQKGKTHE